MDIDKLFNKYATGLLPDYKTEAMTKEEFTQAIAEIISLPIEAPVMHAYDWELYGHFGTFDAINMQEALHKIIDFYGKLPYPSEDLVRIDIKCKKRA